MSMMRFSSRPSEPRKIDVIRSMARALPTNGLATTIDACVLRVTEGTEGVSRPGPYIAQHQQRTLLLDAAAPGSWVVAEFRFDEPRVGYREVFRARYASPREAMGAFLARALADGEPAVTSAAAGLDAWYGARIG